MARTSPVANSPRRELNPPRVSKKLFLAGGFLALSAAVFVAHSAPTAGYERSIYTATPIVAWAFLSLAFFVAVFGALIWFRGGYRFLSILLGGTATTVVVALPIIRSYRFMGPADSLTHLGWAKDIMVGAMEPQVLLYPGLHSIAVAMTALFGISLERALMSAVVVLFVVYLVFVPLVVRAFTDDSRMTLFAVLLSWLVLPVNNIATFPIPHTNSNALFFVPVVLFVTILVLRRPGTTSGDTSTLTTSSTRGESVSLGAAFVLVSGGLIVLHPQHALNVLLFLISICLVQFVVRQFRPSHPIAAHRTLYLHTAAFVTMFVLWVSVHPLFRKAVESAVYGLSSTDIGGTSTVSQRGTSLVEIGASLPELFIKLFLVSAVVGIVTAWFAASFGLGRLELETQVSTVVTYVIASLIPLGTLFAVYFAATPKMAFRQLGFIYVLVTILAGVALVALIDHVQQRRWLKPRTIRGALVVTVTAALVLSLVTVFPSPYIYSPSPQVTDQQIDGFDTALTYHADGRPYAALGSDVSRYGDALIGTVRNDVDFQGTGDGFVNATSFSEGELSHSYPDDSFYIAVTSFDIERQIVVYNELHYTRSGLAAMDRQPGVNLVQSNGDFKLFFVDHSS